MEKIKTLILNKKMVINLTAFLFLTSVITIAPLFHFQPVTGPIVNAILFIAVSLLGIEYALLIGLIPSVIALSTGLLPAILAPMIPFIMLSNCDFNYYLCLFKKQKLLVRSNCG